MSRFRVWLFRSLVAIVIVLMLVSWFLPWWVCDSPELGLYNGVVIHPYGLENNLPQKYAMYIQGADMPVWFGPLMWTYLAVVLIGLIYGSLINKKEIKIFRYNINLPKFLFTFIGLSFIVVVICAYIIGDIRSGDYFDMKFIGESLIGRYPAEAVVIGSLKIGYWLACATGPLLIVLGLLRNKIIGNTN